MAASRIIKARQLLNQRESKRFLSLDIPIRTIQRYGKRKTSHNWFAAYVHDMNQNKQSSPWRGLGVIGVLGNYGLAHVFPDACMRKLVTALIHGDEDTSTAAYMALVKLGPRINIQLLIEDMKQSEPNAGLIQLLGDLGNPSAITYLEELSQSPDSNIASAARESIEILKNGD